MHRFLMTYGLSKGWSSVHVPKTMMSMTMMARGRGGAIRTGTDAELCCTAARC